MLFNKHTLSTCIYADDDIRNTKPGIKISKSQKASKSSGADLEMID